jgi:hypothetical protein
MFGSSNELQRNTTLHVLEETIQVCEGADDDFECSWASINDSFPNHGACTEISEDEQTTTSISSSESEIEFVMQKLNSCMERSAETRKHVEMIAADLKKTGLDPYISKTTEVVANASGSVLKDRLPNSKKRSKLVKKRKDFAVTGCLVRPILEKELSRTSVHMIQPALVIVNGPHTKSVSSISDFLRKNKR